MRAFGTARVRVLPVLAVTAIGLSACAVGTPATITSARSEAHSVSGVELLRQEGEAGLRLQFANELTNALTQRGVSLGNSSAFIADFAVSQRPAELGLLEVSEETEAPDAPEPAYKSEPFDECKPNRVNASLVVYSRSSGEVQGKSSGEFLACRGDLEQLSDLAQLLVDRTLIK